VWEWVRYIVVPPSDGFFDLISKPIDTLLTRWPLTYITQILSNGASGFADGTACPLPTFGGTSYNGQSTPTVDPCDWFDGIATTVQNNTVVRTILVTVIYLGLGLAVYYTGIAFFFE